MFNPQDLIKLSQCFKDNVRDLERALELMLSVPSRAYDNIYISSIEGYRGNIQKLGRLLLHEPCLVTEKDGKTHERYCFLFKSRILITKVRKISDKKSIFILQNIIKLPLCNIEDQIEEKRLFLSSKSPDESNNLHLFIKPHNEEGHRVWYNEIQSYINHVVTLQEHAADDLKVDSANIASENELILRLPHKVEAYQPNLDIRPSDVAENYFLSKETKERLLFEEQQLKKIEQEAYELFKAQQNIQNSAQQNIVQQNIEINTTKEIRTEQKVASQSYSKTESNKSEVKLTTSTLDKQESVAPAVLLESSAFKRSAIESKELPENRKEEKEKSKVEVQENVAQTLVEKKLDSSIESKKSDKVVEQHPIKIKETSEIETRDDIREIEKSEKLETREEIREIERSQKLETREEIEKSQKIEKIETRDVISEIEKSHQQETLTEGKNTEDINSSYTEITVQIPISNPIETLSHSHDTHNKNKIELANIPGYNESMYDSDSVQQTSKQRDEHQSITNITDSASLTQWNNRLADIAFRNGGERSAQGPPPPPLPPHFVRMPGFFQPLPLISYETTVEILIIKARPPSPPPRPPPPIKRVLVHNESLEQKSQNFLEGIYDVSTSDTSLRNAKQKIRNIKTAVLKSADSTNYAQDTVKKAKARDFVHIFNPPIRKKRPIFEIVEEPVNICEIEGDYTESIADDFRDSSVDLEARGRSVCSMDDNYSSYSLATKRRIESKFQLTNNGKK